LSKFEIVIIASHRVTDSIGGVEKFVVSLSSWLDKKCFDVTIVNRVLSVLPVKTTHGPLLDSSNQETRLIKTVELPLQFFYLGLSFFSLCALLALLKNVKISRIKGKHILALHSQDTNFAALATVIAGGLSGIPSVIHQHGPYIDLLRTKNMKVIEKSINRITCRLSNRVVTTDKSSKDYLLTIISDPKKITVLPASVEVGLFTLKCTSSRNKSDYFQIGYIGRLSPEKNIETLVLAFSNFIHRINTPCKLLLVGDGESRMILEKLTEKLGVSESVVFTGFKTDVKPLLSTFDVFVLPSIFEGTPISLLEAMAAEKAIIASNLPSISEIITDGQDALLFDPHNVESLTNALIKFYNDPELRKKLGTKAKETVATFDVDQVFEKIVYLYRDTAIELNSSGKST
jgi:glycosyltransferase involved in cell wall biosynthesis